MRTETYIVPTSYFLNHGTAIKAALSDHNILIRGQTLFFNMMMQGRWNEEKQRYNNGFKKIETNADYQIRIRNVVRVLAETVHINPHITIIGLVEAPIKPDDIDCMIKEAKKLPSLASFIPSFTPESFTPMGVATFISHDHFSVVNDVKFDQKNMESSLTHRVKKFTLDAKKGGNNFELVNLHLPFDVAKSNDLRGLIKFSKGLFSQHHHIPVLVMGDFNMYPGKIAGAIYGIVSYIQKNNSFLVATHGMRTSIELDTVDGILQSQHLKEKDRDYLDARKAPNAGVNLYLEHRFFSPKVKMEEQDEEQNDDLMASSIHCGMK